MTLEIRGPMPRRKKWGRLNFIKIRGVLRGGPLQPQIRRKCLLEPYRMYERLSPTHARLGQQKDKAREPS